MSAEIPPLEYRDPVYMTEGQLLDARAVVYDASLYGEVSGGKLFPAADGFQANGVVRRVCGYAVESDDLISDHERRIRLQRFDFGTDIGLAVGNITFPRVNRLLPTVVAVRNRIDSIPLTSRADRHKESSSAQAASLLAQMGQKGIDGVIGASVLLEECAEFTVPRLNERLYFQTGFGFGLFLYWQAMAPQLLQEKSAKLKEADDARAREDIARFRKLARDDDAFRRAIENLHTD